MQYLPQHVGRGTCDASLSNILRFGPRYLLILHPYGRLDITGRVAGEEEEDMEAPQHHHHHPHRSSSGGGGGELFICFASRPSSSAAAMRPPSGARSSSSSSLMSPGRCRDPAAPPLSLSSSLSRRLRNNGSLKGGQSPATFPAAGVAAARKKGGAFEAVEPSSPKVTCIGQVRVRSAVRTKPKGAVAVGSRSASFWRSEEAAPEKTRPPLPVHGGGGGEEKELCGNQRWVHQLSLAICEALRSIGSEINCFAPCSSGGGGGGRSSRAAGENDEKGGEALEGNAAERRSAASGASSSSCAAVFARWLMAESEVGKRGEDRERRRCDMDLLAGDGEENDDSAAVSKPAINIVVKSVEEESAAAAAPEKICEPPRNALLLMRCRSDPARMAALGNRLWGLPVAPAKIPAAGAPKEEEDDGEEVAEAAAAAKQPTLMQEAEEPVGDQGISSEEDAKVFAVVAEEAEALDHETEEEVEQSQELAADERDEHSSKEATAEAAAKGDLVLPPENRASAAPEEEGMKGKRSRSLTERRSKAKDLEMRRSRSARDKERRRNSFSSERESSSRRQSFSSEKGASRRASFSVDGGGGGSRRGSFSVESKDAKPAAAKIKTLPKSEANGAEKREKSVAGESKRQGGGGGASELPDCLLLMMYEPKLSMEVSKETWVCSTDFLHWRPPRYLSNAAAAAVAVAGDEDRTVVKEEISNGDAVKQPPLLAPQPPMEEELPLVEHVPAPFVLTRCKSAPTRSSESLAVALPGTWFWKNRHQPIAGTGEFVV